MRDENVSPHFDDGVNGGDFNMFLKQLLYFDVITFGKAFCPEK